MAIEEVLGAIRVRLVDRRSRLVPDGSVVRVLGGLADVLGEDSVRAAVWPYPASGVYVVIKKANATTAVNLLRRPGGSFLIFWSPVLEH